MLNFERLPSWLAWIEPWLPILFSVSAVSLLISLFVLPILVVRMPSHYFVGKRRVRKWTLPRKLFYVLRNSIALLLLLAGLAMLILPGQGLLTILMAVMVSDLPGKYKVERWLVCKPGVLRSLNWIRSRYHRPPLKKPSSINR